MPIFRAPMRPRDRDVPAGAGARHGFEHGIVGIGPARDDKDHRMVRRFADVPDGSFVWTRLDDGTYRLGRIDGPLRHDDSPAAHEVGIHHVRATDWLDRPITADEVPAAVAETFARGGRNFQQTHSATAEQRTAELWAARR